MNETEKVGTNLEKKLEHLENEIETVKKKLDKIGKEVGANQPSSKIKVVKTYVDDDGERRKEAGSQVVAKIRGKVHKNGHITTPEVEATLESKGYSRSRNSVLTLMRRMAEEFDGLQFSDSRTSQNKAYKLVSSK